MMKIAAMILTLIFEESLGINLANYTGGSVLEKMDSKSVIPFFKDLKHMWADSGDSISYAYAGTQATTSNMTKHGNKQIINKIKNRLGSGKVAVQRFVRGQFIDSVKQEIFSIIVGQHYQFKNGNQPLTHSYSLRGGS